MPFLDPGREDVLDPIVDDTFLNEPHEDPGQEGYWNPETMASATTLITGAVLPLNEVFRLANAHVASLLPPADASSGPDGRTPSTAPFLTPELQAYLTNGLSSVLHAVRAIAETYPPSFRGGSGGGALNQSPDNGVRTVPRHEQELFLTTPGSS